MSWRDWFREPEIRQATTFTDLAISALVAQASGSGAVDVSTLAAAETARSLWGRSFTAAESDVLQPGQLEMIGRAMVSPGEIVFLRAGRELIPCASWDIRGLGVRPVDWRYRCTLHSPSGQLTREVGYEDVAHFKVRCSPAEPWRGRSAWATCQTTSALAARLEVSLANEERSGVGSVVPVPDAAKASDDGVAKAMANARGTILLGDSQAAMDAGTGRAAIGREWQPVRFGPSPPPGQIELRSGVAADILGAAGVPAALVSPDTPAAALREAWRQFLHASLSPIGRIVAAEAQRVLGGSGELSWQALGASDISGRARAYGSLVKADMSAAEARRIAGI